jgi:C-terminal processing protease CtpA/Prc
MGRGTVQSIIDLPSGSRLRIPTGDLIEPGVGVISGRGVEPDVALAPTPAGGADADDVIRFGVQVLSATRSGQRADLIDAAHRMLAWRSKR